MNALMLALEQSLALSMILAMKTTAACIVLSKHEPQEQVAACLVLSGSRAAGVLSVWNHPKLATHSWEPTYKE